MGSALGIDPEVAREGEGFPDSTKIKRGRGRPRKNAGVMTASR